MLVAVVFQLVGKATFTDAEQYLGGVFQMPVTTPVVGQSRLSSTLQKDLEIKDYQNRSFMGREAPSHQNTSLGICFRDHWSQSKVKAHSVEHRLILKLSSPGFLHQADPVTPLFETFKWLPLSRKPHILLFLQQPSQGLDSTSLLGKMLPQPFK